MNSRTPLINQCTLPVLGCIKVFGTNGCSVQTISIICSSSYRSFWSHKVLIELDSVIPVTVRRISSTVLMWVVCLFCELNIRHYWTIPVPKIGLSNVYEGWVRRSCIDLHVWEDPIIAECFVLSEENLISDKVSQKLEILHPINRWLKTTDYIFDIRQILIVYRSINYCKFELVGH